MTKTIVLTPAQASLVEVELLGRFAEDGSDFDPEPAWLAPALAEFARSNGRRLAVSPGMYDDVVEVANGLDVLANSRDWANVGGVETQGEARRIASVMSTIASKVLRAERM